MSSIKGNYTVATFLNLQGAFDYVGAHTAIGCLRALSFRGCMLRFLECYLEAIIFAVKVGNGVNLARPLFAGLPQGSALSPRLFNVVIERVSPSNLRGPLVV